jgi:membrane fusion protein (multidrug efflux system)
MHRIVIPLALLGALVIGLIIWQSRGGDPAAGGGPGGPGGGGGGPPGGMQLPVEAMTVQPEQLAHGLTTVGTIRADEWVVVRPEVPGRIVKIHFTEGERVEPGAVLFTLDASVPRAALREAQANLENARRINTRTTELANQQLISRTELDNAQAQLSVSEARVASARAQLEKMTLVAPFGGVVGLREVSVGAFVTVGQTMVTLARLDPIEVDFSLPERDLARAAVGRKLTLTVEAFAGETFTGKIEAIDPMMDVNSRSARLRAQVDNPDHKLRPGLFARINLDTGEGAKALMVPEQALLQQGDIRFVYKIVNGKAARTEVKTGQRLPGKVEVIDGLKAGDQVITAGQGKPMMMDGMPVMVLPAGGGKPPGPGGAPPAGGQPAPAPASKEAKPAAQPAPAEAKAAPPAASKPAAAEPAAGETREN